ncbi:MAG TPA: MerR family transcriptional regulator [Vicinamibacterales bacterium]|nr:MerR family transcriptional regulator [Vicinamibacterales bacterium]
MMPATIPNRPVFRSQEVCEIAEVQPYVLRSWEAEFPDLGVAKTAAGPRVYRRGDVERVLRLKHLLFVDGLTLAGARKRLSEEGQAPAEDTISDADVAAMLDEHTRDGLRDVKRGLQWILGVLSGHGVTPEDRVLMSGPPPARSAAKKAAAPSRNGAHGKAAKKSARKSKRR